MSAATAEASAGPPLEKTVLLYVEVKGRKRRVCEGCHHPILRNLAIVEGRAWHYGELRATEHFGKVVAMCRNCVTYLTKTNITRIGYDLVQGKEVVKCSQCGSEDLQFLEDRRTGE